jgi:hypothetical protein
MKLTHLLETPQTQAEYEAANAKDAKEDSERLHAALQQAILDGDAEKEAELRAVIKEME